MLPGESFTKSRATLPFLCQEREVNPTDLTPVKKFHLGIPILTEMLNVVHPRTPCSARAALHKFGFAAIVSAFAFLQERVFWYQVSQEEQDPL